MERFIKAETLLPLLVAALMALGLIACKKEAPTGPQYTLSKTFLENTRSDFRIGTRWVYRDSANRASGDDSGRFSLTLNKLDSLYLQAGPGITGYRYYEFTFGLLSDPSVIRLPKDSLIRDTVILDSLTGRDTITIDTIRQDTIVGRVWRVLPYQSVLAGTVLGDREQAIFFHDSTMAPDKVKHGLRYLGVQPVSLRRGTVSGNYNAQRYAGEGISIDSLSATQMDWAPNLGLIRFRTRSGRVFELDSLKRP